MIGDIDVKIKIPKEEYDYLMDCLKTLGQNNAVSVEEFLQTWIHLRYELRDFN